LVKVLHFADLHLGVENYGHPEPTTGLHSRLADFLRSLDELVEYALAESVDLVLFAGDAYKSRDPNPTHQRELAKRVHLLASHGIAVFLLAGNHDIPGTLGRANTLDIFSALEVPNVTVGREPAVYRVATRSGNVQIVAIPWLVRSHLLAREEHRNRTLEEVDVIALRAIEGFLNKAVADLDQQLPTILAMHGTVHGAKYGSERSVMLGQEMVLPLGLLTIPAFDYVALGHIHSYQQLQTKPPVIYSGSLDRIDFGEEGERKGFVVANVSKGAADCHFVPIRNTRPMVTVKVRCNSDDPMHEVSTAIAGADIRNAIVRLIIDLTEDNCHLVRDSEIAQLTGDAWKVTAVVKNVARSSRIRWLGGDKVAQMTPREVLVKYLQLRQTDPERQEKLLAYAHRIMGDPSNS